MVIISQTDHINNSLLLEYKILKVVNQSIEANVNPRQNIFSRNRQSFSNGIGTNCGKGSRMRCLAESIISGK